MNSENNMNDFRGGEESIEKRSDFILKATKSYYIALGMEWHDLICVPKANFLVMQTEKNWKGKKVQMERKVRQLLH